MNMIKTPVDLNDLPDEILLIILEKLENVETLYSLYGLSKRFNQLLRDPIITSSLTSVIWLPNKFLSKFSSNLMLNRFRLDILPDISIQIRCLHLESSSMKLILRAADYPNLYALGLYNINEKTARRLFIDERLSSGLFKKQIKKLIIGINRKKNDWCTAVKICTRIFSVFINLTDLIFCESSHEKAVPLLFDIPFRRFSSSSLLELNLKVQNFSTLLYLVDGRFTQLHTLIVDLNNIVYASELVEKKMKISNLKSFVLSCAWEISCYDELIVPLLNRMVNLEKLGLYLTSYVEDRFIDGNHLKKYIFNRMPQLNTFTFHICSLMFIKNQMNFPSKEDIQRTFHDFQNTKIISYMDYFQEKRLAQCHVHSYPSKTKYYQRITNQFPGGLYQCVRFITLYDQYPFEHEFFIRISQSFPLLQTLSLINNQPQQNKQSYQSTNTNHNLSIATYNYLLTLEIQKAHDDYLEEFLLSTKTCFRNQILLHVDYNSLERVTNKFTRDDIRINCANINEIYIFRSYSLKSLRDYFPSATIH